MSDTEILLKKLNDVEKMLWEDRKFLIGMMMKIDRIVDFVSDVTTMEEAIFDNNIEVDEEQILKSIMNSLKDDIDNKKEEFIKYHKMINSDQVGES
jgi:hypothetical protein|tara:strand:- start:141 stop:428 length:288 start_codon:yes stop_codon:yes gene_type:complete